MTLTLICVHYLPSYLHCVSKVLSFSSSEAGPPVAQADLKLAM